MKIEDVQYYMSKDENLAIIFPENKSDEDIKLITLDKLITLEAYSGFHQYIDDNDMSREFPNIEDRYKSMNHEEKESFVDEFFNKTFKHIFNLDNFDIKSYDKPFAVFTPVNGEVAISVVVSLKNLTEEILVQSLNTVLSKTV